MAINARLIRDARSSLAALLFFAVTTVSAQDVAEIPLFNAPQGTTALGGGIRFGQNMYLASDNEDERKLDLIPLYLFEGRYLFFRGTMGGVHIINNDSLELSLIGRYRFQSLKPESNVFYQGINERKQSFDAGVQIRLTKNWGQLNLNWVTDTLNRHKGRGSPDFVPLHLRGRTVDIFSIHWLVMAGRESDQLLFWRNGR